MATGSKLVFTSMLKCFLFSNNSNSEQEKFILFGRPYEQFISKLVYYCQKKMDPYKNDLHILIRM